LKARKRCAGMAISASPPRFNGAAPLKARKHAAAHDARYAADAASMGPRR